MSSATETTTSPPVLAVRGTQGAMLNQGPPGYEVVSSFPRITSNSVKCITFSRCGRYFACCDDSKITIMRVPTWKVMHEIPKPKIYELEFSSNGTYLMSWKTFTVSKDNPEGSPNLHIWKVEDGSLAFEVKHPSQIDWKPQWSKDEKICARITKGELLLFEAPNFTAPTCRISNPRPKSFSLSFTTGAYHILCYIPGNTGPSFARLFKYPKFENFVASKTFFKVDNVEMRWNYKGTQVLLLMTTDVDKSSYYGKQALFSMDVRGKPLNVLLDKEGPIYDVRWSPTRDEFCAIYGAMPAKAAIFDNKCEIIHDLGCGPKNSIYFNPHGNILMIAGFGNIQGHCETWEVMTKRRIAKFTAPDTTKLEWSPDGCHFVTATTAPRLRTKNGFKIWHYSGALLYERPWNMKEELWDVQWQKFPDGTFRRPIVSFKLVEGIAPTEPISSKIAYRPPGARGLPLPPPLPKIQEEENRPLSKMQLKLKKKRDNKRQAKLHQGSDPGDKSPEDKPKLNNGHNGGSEDRNPEINSANNTEDTFDAKNANTSSGVNAKISKIRKLKMTLKDIKKLKEQKSAGKELDKNQMEKLAKEESLLKELSELTL